MTTSSSSITAGEIMDRAAVLMNDPAKTDYNYDTLAPFLRMAIDELVETLGDSQSSPLVYTDPTLITMPIGSNTIYSPDSLNTPHYSGRLMEIQELSERRAGSQDSFIPMRRIEFIDYGIPAASNFGFWSWEAQQIRFNPNGATTPREIQFKIIMDASNINFNIAPEQIIGAINARSFLAYKTAAFAAMFIGENPERAKVLNEAAETSLERIESVNNKGRQQIMTRHRPFRAAYKRQGGF